jgi:hypothetical protein
MDRSVINEGQATAGEASGYFGNIPQHYDQNLGPLLFTDYAADLAGRIATLNPRRVLETAALPKADEVDGSRSRHLGAKV